MKRKHLFYSAAIPAALLAVSVTSDTYAFEAYPERTAIDIYPNAENLNRIIITGTDPSEIRFVLKEGDGEFKYIGRQWYWSLIPDYNNIGMSRIIKYTAFYGGGTRPLDSVNGDFVYTINQLNYLDEPYGPLSQDGSALFAGRPFYVRVKGIGLNGEYKIVMKMNGETVKIVNEPSMQWNPDYVEDIGKTVSFSVYYRPIRDCNYEMIDFRSFTVKPIPLLVTIPFTVHTTPYIVFTALEGIRGQLSMTESDKLFIESDGFLGDTAYRLYKFETGIVPTAYILPQLFKASRKNQDTRYPTDMYIVKVTSKVRNISGRKAHIFVKVTNPITGVTDRVTAYLKR